MKTRMPILRGMIALVILFSTEVPSFSQGSGPGRRQAKQGIPAKSSGVDRTELERFEQFVIAAAEHGATHVSITDDLPPALWQFDTPGDPYPAWYVYRPGLMKIFPPPVLRPYVDTVYAERVASLLEARCEILKRHGLRGFYAANEPHLLPEGFFTDYPELRGPRVDHPNRSRVARFAPCVDNPEVLAMYRQSMQLLTRRCPEVEIFSFLTSDSGSGFCWSPALYAGRNGNSVCRERPMGDRVAGFLTCLQDAAEDLGSHIEINIRPVRPRQWMLPTFENPELVAGQLGEGLTISGYANAVGERSGSGRPAWGGEDFHPVAGLSNPLNTARRLTAYYRRGDESASRLIVSYSDPRTLDFNLRLYEFLESAKPVNQADMILSLRNFAIEYAGEDAADDLLDIWMALDDISNDLMVLNFGSVLEFGPVLARWINRPLVPFPGELKQEEKSYYRTFLFQAKGEEQADNLIDIQAMRMFEGYGARLLVQRVYEMVMADLSRAENLAAGLRDRETDPALFGEWKGLVNRLAVLHCLVQTIDNTVAYQALLDLVHSRGVKPEADPVLGTQASWDRQEIQRIARNEIDNTARLKELLESSAEPLIHTAKSPELETIRMLGPELPRQLKYKIDIMNAHWTDYNRLYTAPNL